MKKVTARGIFQALIEKRNIANLDEFIVPDYSRLADPYLMPDMAAALDRLELAISQKQKIAVFGDYDVDGLTATALLSDALANYGVKVEQYIPDRFKDGYGLSGVAIREFANNDVDLIITVDTGSLAFDEIKLAKKHGMDVIVTDHHETKKELPEAVAILNPKRTDSRYPFRELAGVGVAFTLVRGLQKRNPLLKKGQEKWLLDLVALGTTCDVVPLKDENRTLVYWGLKVARKGRRPAFAALAETSRIKLDSLKAEDFGFRFGPRINASGRMQNALLSLKLLSSKEQSSALRYANKLEKNNSERRSLQAKITNEIEELAKHSKDQVLVLTGKGWSHGVVGIVASKICEQYGKPTFVLEERDSISKGSARSFGEFDLAAAINATGHLLIKGGGHSKAAGVTLKTVDIKKFRKAINEYYESLHLKEQEQYLTSEPDMEIPSFDGLSLELVELIAQLEPFGHENEKPVFEATAVINQWRRVGQAGKHAKVLMEDRNGQQLSAIAFGQAGNIPEPGNRVVAKFRLEENVFNGNTSLQANIIEVRESVEAK